MMKVLLLLLLFFLLSFSILAFLLFNLKRMDGREVEYPDNFRPARDMQFHLNKKQSSVVLFYYFSCGTVGLWQLVAPRRQP